MVLGVIALVGEHRLNPRHDGKGSQEQPLEYHGIVDVRGCRHAGDRDAVTVDGDMILGS